MTLGLYWRNFLHVAPHLHDALTMHLSSVFISREKHLLYNRVYYFNRVKKTVRQKNLLAR